MVNIIFFYIYIYNGLTNRKLGFLPFTEVPPENNNLALGDEVEARVIRVEQTTRKIWLSIRQVDIKVRQLIRPPLQLVLERPTKQPQEKTTSETTDEDEFVRQQQQQQPS